MSDQDDVPLGAPLELSAEALPAGLDPHGLDTTAPSGTVRQAAMMSRKWYRSRYAEADMLRLSNPPRPRKHRSGAHLPGEK